MEEKVIDLTNAQVGDKFRREDGEVVTVVCRFFDMINTSDWLCIVDKKNKGCMYMANDYGATLLNYTLIDQVDIPQMPAPGVSHPQAEGAGVPFSGTNESDKKLAEMLELVIGGVREKLADAEKESRIARRERIAIEIVNKMEYISAGSMKELIDNIEDAIIDIDEVKVKIADPDTL